MSGISKLTASAVLSLLIVAPVVQAAPISLSHHEQLQRLSIQRAGADRNQKIGVVGPVDMSFDALGRSFELQLAPNKQLLDAAHELTGGTATPYRGQLVGNEDSWVRLVFSEGIPSGVIWDGNELYAIERPGDNIAGTDTTIIYRLADAFIEPGSMSCGFGGSLTDGSVVYKALVSELDAESAQAAGAASEIDIGIVADAEFYVLHGDNSGNAIVERMSLVDGYFSEQVGVQINYSKLVQIFSNPDAASYPFTDSVKVDTGVQDDPDDLLVQLRIFRNNEPNQRVTGLTHLWTGKDIEGRGGSSSTVGIAYRGALCEPQYGAGLSEGRGSPTFDSLVAAHEIGHNFGAPHDGRPGACESVDVATNDYLMEASLTQSSQFSQCSLDQMADDIANAGCITPLPSWDMSLSPDDPAPTVLLGNSATVTFDVVNVGTEEAANVVADFTLPTNVSLISAAASMGRCIDGGGIVSCAIGNVQGTTTVSVTLTSDTVAVGNGTFNASVAADLDNEPANNQSSLTLTVQPAVNLAITPPSTRQLSLDQSTGLTALLENTSILDASGVALSITLPPGLRADSASWPLGSCTVTNSQVDCEGTSFAALSNATLSLGVTATTEGSKTINFSMSSTETEADPTNNTASAVVNVGTPAQEESGGGSTSWLLPLLGLFAIRRRGLSRG